VSAGGPGGAVSCAGCMDVSGCAIGTDVGLCSNGSSFTGLFSKSIVFEAVAPSVYDASACDG
jgi:hypothetical protein